MRNPFCGHTKAATASRRAITTRIRNAETIRVPTLHPPRWTGSFNFFGQLGRSRLAPRYTAVEHNTPVPGGSPCASGGSLGRALFLPNMSVKVSGLVWDCQLPREEKYLALAYADHANHDGTSVYPSRETVTRMTGYSRRSVQTITARMVDKGILIIVGESHLRTVEYRFDMEKLREGAEIAPCKKEHPEGAVATAPNPSVDPSDIEFASVDGDSVPPEPPPEPPFDTFWKLYPVKKDKDAARRSWVRQKLDNKRDLVIAGLTDQRRAGMLNDFIPYPSTWLNNKRWEDEISTPKTNGKTKTHLRSSANCAANAGTHNQGKARDY